MSPTSANIQQKSIYPKTPLWFYFCRSQKTLVKMNLSEANNTFMPDALTLRDGLYALFTCNLLVSLPANVYVLRLIARGPGGAVTPDLFAFNLSISEILFCVLSLNMMLHFWLRMPGAIGIPVLQCIIELMFISRTIFQGCICLERYLAVVHPTLFFRYVKKMMDRADIICEDRHFCSFTLQSPDNRIFLYLKNI